MSSYIMQVGREYWKETHYSTRDFCTLDVLDLKPLKMLFFL